jgi:tetraacyldisaccharide 4'-kinase
MIRPPRFWIHDRWWVRMLAPLSSIWAATSARRIARPGWSASVPVICCGNATVGGAGKTTLTLDLACRLTARGFAVHILSRGYRGAERGSRRVLRGDSVAMTGDEALLLARVAPTWTGSDRAATARDAIAAGAEILLMDDGLQNPTLEKTMSLLVVDGTHGFGNGRMVPAGPLREPVAAAASRCRAAVMIGSDEAGALAQLPSEMPVLRASKVQVCETATLTGRRGLAFAGIASPEKFFAALERMGVLLVGRKAFADHHTFTTMELNRLLADARALGAVLITTPKDAVRLPAGMPVEVVDVRLVWETDAGIDALLDELVSGRSPNSPPSSGPSVA